MDRTKVESSQIESIGYDFDTHTLEIEFKGRKEAPGSVYRYEGVSREQHAALMMADSVGKYFGANIRGKYPTIKLQPEVPAEGSRS